MKTGTSFFVKPSDLDRVVNSATKAILKEKTLLTKNMRAIVIQVYNTAHAKRPMITAKQAKAERRNKRVSDPGASFGVPVDTGALQASIKQEVTDTGKKVVGSIYIDPESPAAKYAAYLEFGTSRMKARPFMRPALHLNEAWIKAKFRSK